jgi:hypothetical protein
MPPMQCMSSDPRDGELVLNLADMAAGYWLLINKNENDRIERAIRVPNVRDHHYSSLN